MLRVQKKIITGSQDTKIFNAKFEQLTGGKLTVPSQFLSSGYVCAFYTDQGEMVGGFIINDKPPFRYLSKIPESEQPAFVKENIDNFCEVICGWLNRKSCTFFQRYHYYICMILEMHRCQKKYVLSGTEIKSYLRTQRHIVPNLLWHGTAVDTKREQWVLWVERSKIWKNGIIGVVSDIPKDIAKRLRKRIKGSKLIECFS